MLIVEKTLSAKQTYKKVKQTVSQLNKGNTVYLHNIRNIAAESDVSFSILDITRAIGLPDPPKISGTGDIFKALGLTGVADIQIKSITDIPILGDAMKWSSSTFGINWELNDSPFWRDYGGLVIAGVATIVTGGLAAAALGAVATAGILGTSLTISGIAGTAGGSIAAALTQDQKDKYYAKIATQEINQQTAELEKSLEQIAQVKEQQLAKTKEDMEAIEKTEKELTEKLNSIRVGEILKVAVPLGVAGLAGIFLV